ncbi:MAG: hypothetical protein HY694_09270 [Deltaproteobacteria bacterium]|nr:hypothetical protein [Deltaproteobacteria bacterium]
MSCLGIARIKLKQAIFLLLVELALLTCGVLKVFASERFFLSIPGPSLSYAHLFYGQEKGFFAQEGLDLQVLVVRGQIGISSLQKKFSIKETGLVRRMYEDDIETIVLSGRLDPELTKEILETGREVLKIKEIVPVERVFDFSMTDEAAR